MTLVVTLRILGAVLAGAMLSIVLYQAWKSPERPPVTVAVIALLLLCFLGAIFI